MSEYKLEFIDFNSFNNNTELLKSKFFLDFLEIILREHKLFWNEQILNIAEKIILWDQISQNEYNFFISFLSNPDVSKLFKQLYELLMEDRKNSSSWEYLNVINIDTLILRLKIELWKNLISWIVDNNKNSVDDIKWSNVVLRIWGKFISIEWILKFHVWKIDYLSVKWKVYLLHAINKNWYFIVEDVESIEWKKIFLDIKGEVIEWLEFLSKMYDFYCVKRWDWVVLISISEKWIEDLSPWNLIFKNIIPIIGWRPDWWRKELKWYYGIVNWEAILFTWKDRYTWVWKGYTSIIHNWYYFLWVKGPWKIEEITF